MLDVFERVNREHTIVNLRWTLAHLEDASEPTLKRMKTLGVGWALQDAGYFEGESQLKEKGAEAITKSSYSLIEVEGYPKFLCHSSKYRGIQLKQGTVVRFAVEFSSNGAIADRPQIIKTA